MFKFFNKKALLVTISILSACSFTTDNLRDEPEAKTAKTETSVAKPAETKEDAPYKYQSLSYSDTVSSGQSGDTFVGQKIQALKDELSAISGRTNARVSELEEIRNKISEDARKYHELIALINSRLQIGTTPGNPILNEKWHQAGIQLEAISTDVASLNSLLAGLTADSGMVTYVLDSIKGAFSISGAVDEDHNQLKTLQGEAIQTSVKIDGMFNDINLDINRQQQYLANEQRNLTALSMAIRDGQLYSTNPINASSYAPQEYNNSVVSSTVANREVIDSVRGKRPLVTIRFDKRNVSYEQALYQAVKKALARKSSVEFDVVGISPASGSVGGVDVKRSSDAVYKSLTNMGVPANRIRTATMTSSEVKSVEIRIFVR